jgi:hypothetical protein
MSEAKFILTSKDLAQHYQVPAATIRMVIDRTGIGTRLRHWRVVLPTELERLEAGLRALGYKIPAEPQLAMERHVPEEEPQPAVEGDAPWI